LELVNQKKYMKAAVLFEDNKIRYIDVPMPRIEKGMILVKVGMSGICGSDVPRVNNHTAFYYPIVLGHEFMGTVVEVGETIKSFRIGDRISGIPLIPCMQCKDCMQGNYASCRKYDFIGSRRQGSFAEYILLPGSNAIRVEDSVSDEQAVLFEPATVALHALFHAGYRGGETVAILGGGTVGYFVAQLAKIFGAKKIVVFDNDESRLKILQRLGIDAVINTDNPEYYNCSMDLTEGKGFGFVFEAAGQPTTMNIAFSIAATKAGVCFIGTPHVGLTFSPEIWELMNRKEFQLKGSWMSYSAPFPGKEWELVAHFFATGQLKFDQDLIYKKFPLSEADKAFELFKTPKLVRGKILLTNI
jgi:L-iditol 2-dehydrogenase